MTSYGSWEGSDLAWEMIFEYLQDARYELEGPNSYDPDYKKQLREDGEWKAELERWEEPDENKKLVLEGRIEAYKKAINACQKASDICAERVAQTIGHWPHGRPHRKGR